MILFFLAAIIRSSFIYLNLILAKAPLITFYILTTTVGLMYIGKELLIVLMLSELFLSLSNLITFANLKLLFLNFVYPRESCLLKIINKTIFYLIEIRDWSEMSLELICPISEMDCNSSLGTFIDFFFCFSISIIWRLSSSTLSTFHLNNFEMATFFGFELLFSSKSWAEASVFIHQVEYSFEICLRLVGSQNREPLQIK